MKQHLHGGEVKRANVAASFRGCHLTVTRLSVIIEKRLYLSRQHQLTQSTGRERERGREGNGGRGRREGVEVRGYAFIELLPRALLESSQATIGAGESWGRSSVVYGLLFLSFLYSVSSLVSAVVVASFVGDLISSLLLLLRSQLASVITIKVEKQ